MNRGRRGEKIFEGKEDYWSFVEILEELAEVFNVNVAAYCLMTNHYHLLVKTPDANLSRSMRHLNSLYTQRYNRRHGSARFSGGVTNLFWSSLTFMRLSWSDIYTGILIKKSSSVSSIVERMKSGVKSDRVLRMRIEELVESIIKSQEPT